MPTTVQVPLCEFLLPRFHPAAHPSLHRFLIEGSRGTVLHTGDLRAEPWFLASLTRNPFLQPYIPDTEEDLRVLVARGDQPGSLTKTLKAIYLDTACLLRGTVVPTKVMVLNIVRTIIDECEWQDNAVKGLVELIALFDDDTYFFVNAWTWGYEDLLKGIARAFQCKVNVSLIKHISSSAKFAIRPSCTLRQPFFRFICQSMYVRLNFTDVFTCPQIHVDRYKHAVYTHISDPFLRVLVTRDSTSTRFHACERFERCSFVDVPRYDVPSFVSQLHSPMARL